MAINKTTYVAMDLEFNQPFDFARGVPKTPHPSLSFEIIQIGLVLMDSSMEVHGTMELNVRPKLYHRVHPYVARITGISAADLEGCPNFPQCWGKVMKLLGGGAPTFAVWGGSDISLLYKNIGFHRLSDGGMLQKFIDVQQLANKYFKAGGGASIGLKTAVERLKIPQELPYHSALNDAIYTARVLKTLGEA